MNFFNPFIEAKATELVWDSNASGWKNEAKEPLTHNEPMTLMEEIEEVKRIANAAPKNETHKKREIDI